MKRRERFFHSSYTTGGPVGVENAIHVEKELV